LSAMPGMTTPLEQTSKTKKDYQHHLLQQRI